MMDHLIVGSDVDRTQPKSTAVATKTRQKCDKTVTVAFLTRLKTRQARFQTSALRQRQKRDKVVILHDYVAYLGNIDRKKSIKRLELSTGE